MKPESDLSPKPLRSRWEALAFPSIALLTVGAGFLIPAIGEWGVSSLFGLLATFVISLTLTSFTTIGFIRALFARTGFAESIRFLLHRDVLNSLLLGIMLGLLILAAAVMAGIQMPTVVLSYFALVASAFVVSTGMDTIYREQYLIYSGTKRDRERRALDAERMTIFERFKSKVLGREGYAGPTLLWTLAFLVILPPMAGVLSPLIESALLIGILASVIQFSGFALWVKAAENGGFLRFITRNGERQYARKTS